MKGALIKHLTLLDRMMVVEQAIRSRRPPPTRIYKAAIRRLRLSGEFHPKYDSAAVKIAEEFTRTGTSTVAKKWKTRFPGLAEALTMCAVEGIGPKRMLILWREGYNNLDELATAAREGKFDKRGNLCLAAMRAKAEAA